ncbi:uncharacterized protein LOC132733632 [Ruditapes philippinarum]|uniref:uncharacterized protein LOC132733632 n=1 Tax=Ruditapes philippinarum TaxID=129788 RepID=UPI00295AAC93|nr:uncharacterized protein LOC132733632 [Ruditapes philippinarum]
MAVPGKKATKQFSSSTISKGSDEDLKIYCQPCDRDGPRLPAHGYCVNCSEHLCETCFTVHRRHTLSRHHTLLDKSSMPQTLSPLSQRPSDNFTKPCPKHNIEMIKFYCHDHKALLCSVCVTLEHTASSCNVDYIPDISGQIIKSEEYQSVLNEIDDITKKCSKTLKDIKKKNDESNKSLTDVMTDIMKFRTKINQRLDELERQVWEAAKAIQEDNNKHLTKVETVCGDVSKSMKLSSDAIKHLNTPSQANDLFIELKNAEKMMKDNAQRVSKLSKFNIKEYIFEQNESIADFLDKEKSIGTLKSKTFNPALKSRQCSLTDKICIKTSQDTSSNACWITGITNLTPNILIITEYHNVAVKMVDISRKSVLAQHCFDSQPWDVTSVSENELAVTFPGNRSIQFICVSGNNLKKKQAIKVDGLCWGISYQEDKMVVSLSNPAKVQILAINGTVLHTIEDENIFKRPDNIATCDNGIYISDCGMKTITKLNWQCEVKGEYVCTVDPRGLTMSEDWTVFVCYPDNKTIGEISDDCNEGQVVVDDKQLKPWAVHWSDETSSLYTSTQSSSEDDNFIKIFKLSK